jgi:hypothetical protein
VSLGTFGGLYVKITRFARGKGDVMCASAARDGHNTDEVGGII